MGYETQLLVGNQTNQGWFNEGKIKNDYFWFQTYTTVDICKVGSLKDLEPENVTPSYFYAQCGDGNTQINEDQYGHKLIPVPIESVIKRLAKLSKEDDYRRFKWALKTLRAMKAHSDEQLHVLIFGY